MSRDPDEQVGDEDRELLQALLDAYRAGSELPEVVKFRIAHRGVRHRLDDLERAGLVANRMGRYALTLTGLLACGSPQAKTAYQRGRELLADLQRAYLEAPSYVWTVSRSAKERRARSSSSPSREARASCAAPASAR